jgi:hypothetical protein
MRRKAHGHELVGRVEPARYFFWVRSEGKATVCLRR